MKILLCVAGMPYTKPVISLARTIAEATQSSITLLHVVDQTSQRPEGEQMLDTVREMLPGLPVETLIRQGDPVEMILAHLQESDHDLVLVGAHQHPGISERLLGSVTQKLIRRAPTSVLVARPTGLDLERILICTGGLDIANSVIKTGASLARALQTQTTLLHVVTPVPSMYTGLDEMEETLQELLQTDTPIAHHLRHGASILEQHHVDAKLELRYGVTAEEILRVALKDAYDLIIVGQAMKTSPIKEWLLGNVARQIVEHAPCSVLVVTKGTQR